MILLKFSTLTLLIFLIEPFYIQSISIISSSSIEKCINRGSPQDISCDSKMILSLTIQDAELEGSDYVETTLNQVTDNEGNIQKLSSPVKITFSKTPVKVIYPCTYFQDFNYYPREKIISTKSTSCSDSNTDDNPTCGWAYSNGQKVKYSQGFCCSCSFFSFSNSNKRGTHCSGFLDFSASAHCMIFDTLWYSAYNIDKYLIDYVINVNVIDTSDNSTISNLVLSPKITINTNKEKNILVKLIGDFLPTDILPQDFSGKFLIIPTKPSDHSSVILGQKRWMIVDKIRFSLDGKDCDKIGVGYFAFNSQSEKCNVEAGSCLHNQIYHLYNEDMEKINKGKNPEYLIYYDKNYEYSFTDKGVSSRSFSYNLKGNINTLITLEIDTSVLKFTSNVSSGKILGTYVKEFISMSNDGFMIITIKNTGVLTSQFMISYECDDNIITLSSDEISLNREEIKSINKTLYTNSNIGRENKCTIYLQNAIGEKIDSKIINFNTSDEVTMTKQDVDEDNEDSVIYENKNGFNCEEFCDEPLNFFCYLKNSCWEELFTKILILVAGIIVFVIIFKTCKKVFCCLKCFTHILCCNFCCFKFKKKKNKKESSKENIEMTSFDLNKKE